MDLHINLVACRWVFSTNNISLIVDCGAQTSVAKQQCDLTNEVYSSVRVFFGIIAKQFL